MATNEKTKQGLQSLKNKDEDNVTQNKALETNANPFGSRNTDDTDERYDTDRGDNTSTGNAGADLDDTGIGEDDEDVSDENDEPELDEEDLEENDLTDDDADEVEWNEPNK